MNIEKGVKIKGYSDYLIFPEEGKIWSLKSQRFIGYPNESNGYWMVTLCDDNGKQKSYLLHRVVWIAVYGDILEGMQVNHIDENTSNNAITNLNLMTPKENINWGTGIQRGADKKRGVPNPKSAEKRRGVPNPKVAEKLSKQVAAYNKDGVLVMMFPSTAEAQRQGFNKGAVAACCRGKLKSHKGFIWRYAS